MIEETLGQGVRMQWGVRIPLGDGVRLNATLYLPLDHRKPTPAIFTLTPYVGQTYHDRGIYFASHGYPFLTIDTRGRGNSEGEFRPFINEGRDGFDVVEWLACQSYCDGRVVMWGGSYGGFDQWTTAARIPPSLASIVPVAAPYIGVDYPMRGNIFPPYLVQWLTLVGGRTSQQKVFENSELWNSMFRRGFESGEPFKTLDSQLGNPSETFQEWVSHPRRDAYWDSYNPTPQQYANISIPILTITGSYDSDQLGALAHYRQHLLHASDEARARHYLVIGPWDHPGTRTPRAEFSGIQVGPASLIDLPKLHLEWYAWVLRDGPKPAFLRKHVSYYVMGSEAWRYADTLEEVTAHYQTLYLDSEGSAVDIFHSGSLTSTPPEAREPDRYVHDPRDLSLAALESTVDPENVIDQRMVTAAVGRHLVYHSAPFETDIEVSGFFKLAVWLAINQPDTDFCVGVYEIDIASRSVLLTTAWLRARYRESLHQERLIRTHDPLRYDFDEFMFISRYIARGSRLRLVFGPVNSIYAQRNYNSGGVVAEESLATARAVTVSLFHDATHPSALYVPIGQPAADLGVQ